MTPMIRHKASRSVQVSNPRTVALPALGRIREDKIISFLQEQINFAQGGLMAKLFAQLFDANDLTVLRTFLHLSAAFIRSLTHFVYSYFEAHFGMIVLAINFPSPLYFPSTTTSLPGLKEFNGVGKDISAHPYGLALRLDGAGQNLRYGEIIGHGISDAGINEISNNS
jgi:hypothetical protein